MLVYGGHHVVMWIGNDQIIESTPYMQNADTRLDFLCMHESVCLAVYKKQNTNKLDLLQSCGMLTGADSPNFHLYFFLSLPLSLFPPSIYLFMYLFYLISRLIPHIYIAGQGPALTLPQAT